MGKKDSISKAPAGRHSIYSDCHCVAPLGLLLFTLKSFPQLALWATFVTPLWGGNRVTFFKCRVLPSERKLARAKISLIIGRKMVTKTNRKVEDSPIIIVI